MNFYSIECSGSKKDFVITQEGKSDELREIRKYLKSPADENKPPFKIEYIVADDIVADDIKNTVAVPALQTVGFSEKFYELYHEKMKDIFQFVECTLWLNDKSNSWNFYVVRFCHQSDFYNRDATRQYQKNHGSRTHIYNKSGLNFEYAAHDIKRPYFTFTENFYKWMRKDRNGIVMGKKEVLVL